MFNGIGLTTPRGSGTNGYVVRNLSHLRPKDDYQRSQDFNDLKGPRMREPDQGILDHERKREVEVKCVELQDELEEKGIAEDIIETQVAELRERLLAKIATAPPPSARNLRASDTHGLAAAKKAEMDRMGFAMGTSKGYKEGDAFNRDKQDEMKQQRALDRAERERRMEVERESREQRAKEAKERADEEARLRRRREYLAKKEKEMNAKERDLDRARMPPPPSSTRDRSPRRSPSPDRRRRSPSPIRSSRGGRIVSPPPRRRDSRSPMRRSRSPPPLRGGPRYDADARRSRSPPRRRSSPPARRRDSRSPPGRMDSRSPPSRRLDSRSPPPRRMDSRSPPPRRRVDSRSPRRMDSRSPPRRRSTSMSRSRSPPPRRTVLPKRGMDVDRSRSRSRSPPRRRSPDARRSPARSDGGKSAMSVSSD